MLPGGGYNGKAIYLNVPEELIESKRRVV